MKKLILTASVLCMLSAMPALADDQSYHSSTDVTAKTNGDYNATTSQKATDAAGTKTSSEKKDSVSTSSGGDVTTKTSATDTSDPKGMGNSSKTTSDEKVTDKANGDASGTKSTVTKSAGATDKTKTSASIKTDKKGLKTKKVTTKKSHDPKGLLNTSTQTTTDTATQKDNGMTETQHVVKDNGTTIQKTDTTTPTTGAQ